MTNDDQNSDAEPEATTATRRWAAPQHRRRRRVLWGVAALGIAGIARIGGGMAMASADGSRAPAEQSAVGDTVDHVDIPEEFRVPVEDFRDPSPSDEPTGFVDRRRVTPRLEDAETARDLCLSAPPVIDRSGKVIGYWFHDYGFVERDRARAEGFSINAVRAEEYGEDLNPVCFDDGG